MNDRLMLISANGKSQPLISQPPHRLGLGEARENSLPEVSRYLQDQMVAQSPLLSLVKFDTPLEKCDENSTPLN